MARRSYSIVVDPERSAESVDELAERLGPLTRQSAGRLAEALDRGAVTLETDLQRAEAERLFRQLERRSTPVEIRDGEGEVVEVFRPDTAAESAAPEADAEADGGADGEPGLEFDAGDEAEPEAVLEFGPAGPPEADEETDRSEPSGADAGPEEPPKLELGLSELAGDSGTESPDGAEPPGGVGGGSPPREEPFDAGSLDEALEGGAEQSGEIGEASFEDRPAHIPALAAVLSLLAPGAGQAYNGDDDRVWSYAMRAPLILPWIESVRRALERARSIRSGDRPKPAEGSFGRALRHVSLIWVAVAGMGLAAWIAADLVADFRSTDSAPPPRKTRAERLERAIDRAAVGIHDARLSGWERAGHQEVEDDERYTMERGERAGRLFELGYEHCRAGEFAMCESLMQKVAKLDSKYRRSAYRLQVWANVRRRDDGPNPPMPEVAPGAGADVGSGEMIATPPDADTLSGGGSDTAEQ